MEEVENIRINNEEGETIYNHREYNVKDENNYYILRLEISEKYINIIISSINSIEYNYKIQMSLTTIVNKLELNLVKYSNLELILKLFDELYKNNKLFIILNSEYEFCILLIKLINASVQNNYEIKLYKNYIKEDNKFNMLYNQFKIFLNKNEEQINELNIKFEQKENEIKNVLNKKDNIINEMKKELTEQQNRIKLLENENNNLINELKKVNEKVSNIENDLKEINACLEGEEEEENIEKNEIIQKMEEPKIEFDPNKLMMKFKSNLDEYSPYLTEEDIFEMGKVCKYFNKPCLAKLKEINSEKLSKIEFKYKDIFNEDRYIKEFTLGKFEFKAIDGLNDNQCIEYFKKEEAPEDIILLIYRILYQLINKEKDILKEKDNQKFWKLFRENILQNSEKGIGYFLQNEFKNLDFSVENIDRLHKLCKGNEEKLGPINIISKRDFTAKLIIFLIKNCLEYINIIIGINKNKRVDISEQYKKYLEYKIKKRKDNQIIIEKMIQESTIIK